jgi:acyl dehydratase
MALNLDVIGQRTDPEPFSYDRDRVILYALGIGAGVEKELDFVYEKNLKVFPTFALICMTPKSTELFFRVNFNMAAILHGEQTIIMHKEIPSEGTLYMCAIVDSIIDKGDKGAHVIFRREARDKANELVFETVSLYVDRSAGNFGGHHGPKKAAINPPEGKKPDFQVAYKISQDQCALYRLSGDKVQLHIDPNVAKKSGMGRPFFHGLGSMGYAGRAILHSVCDSDPGRFKSFSVRMVSIVYPGDSLITSGWKIEEGKYIILTTNQDGTTVLGNAMAEVV